MLEMKHRVRAPISFGAMPIVALVVAHSFTNFASIMNVISPDFASVNEETPVQIISLGPSSSAQSATASDPAVCCSFFKMEITEQPSRQIEAFIYSMRHVCHIEGWVCVEHPTVTDLYSHIYVVTFR